MGAPTQFDSRSIWWAEVWLIDQRRHPVLDERLKLQVPSSVMIQTGADRKTRTKPAAVINADELSQ